MGLRRPPKSERPALWRMKEKRRAEYRAAMGMLLDAKWNDHNKWFEKYDFDSQTTTYYSETGVELTKIPDQLKSQMTMQPYQMKIRGMVF